MVVRGNKTYVEVIRSGDGALRARSGAAIFLRDRDVNLGLLLGGLEGEEIVDIGEGVHCRS